MRSKWYELKEEAILLRKQGISIRNIEKRLGIPRSTLNEWFKDVELTLEQKQKLLQDWKSGLIQARKKAVKWHNDQKQKRLKEAEQEALKVLDGLNIQDSQILDLALSMLYLGEGFKTTVGLGLGNSDPIILQFFIAAIVNVYNFDKSKIRCELHLRADQDPLEIKNYWSQALDLPLKNFTSVSIDQRTQGTRTFETYKGVCVLRFSSASIQRKLMSLSKQFCDKVIKNLGA